MASSSSSPAHETAPLSGEQRMSNPHAVPDVSFRNAPRNNQPPAPPHEPDLALEEELDLKYGAHHVIMLFTPVTLCLAVVVATISSVTYYTEKGQYFIYTPFHETSSDTVTVAWNAFANAGILLLFIAFMTCMLIVAYKCR